MKEVLIKILKQNKCVSDANEPEIINHLLDEVNDTFLYIYNSFFFPKLNFNNIRDDIYNIYLKELNKFGIINISYSELFMIIYTISDRIKIKYSIENTKKEGVK